MCNYIFVQNKKKNHIQNNQDVVFIYFIVITSSRKPEFICLNYNISVHPV